ncbi:MAG: NTP transferase domain-containing protein [Candidatus Latescibacteria bacterium]|nr:NTP transferase domain-containing protein [Candidatus Latescibacterota bacterium]
MKALILAAGRGRRLWPFTADRPKCLLSIGPTSILEQQLRNLERIAVSQVALVCGFGVDLIARQLDAYCGPLRIKLLYNPFFDRADNLISMWLARPEMDGDFVLLNGDNVFHPDILPRLLASTGPCTLMASHKASYDDDDMKLQLQGRQVRRIGKDLPLPTAVGESLGIMAFRGNGRRWIFAALEKAVRDQSSMQRCYVDALQMLIDQGRPVEICSAHDLPWADVDTPADLRMVRNQLSLYQASPPSPRPQHYREVGEQL